MKKLSLVIPLKNYALNQGYGAENTWPEMIEKYKAFGLSGHNGLDLDAQTGTPVYASHPGTVTYAGLDGANGYLIVIKTDEEFEYENGTAYFKTLYGHLLLPLYVYVGKKVNTGDFIAYSDNTGMSTGPHLHWGLKPVRKGEADWQWFNVEQDNGYNGAIDPTPYIEMKSPGIPYTIKDVQTIWQAIKELQFAISHYNK